MKLSETIDVKDLERDERIERLESEGGGGDNQILREGENRGNLIEVGAGEVDGVSRVHEINVFLQSYLLLSPHSSSSSLFLSSPSRAIYSETTLL